MTAPVVPQAQEPHVLSYAEWEQAQYAPHRLGTEDPTKPEGAGRILTWQEFDQASRAGSISGLKFPALPKIQAAPRESTATPASPASKGVLAPQIEGHLGGYDAQGNPVPGIGNILTRQVINPIGEHPLASVALGGASLIPIIGPILGATMAGKMVHTIASYGWQKAAEQSLSPEERKLAEADPERISGESAAAQAIMLGLGALVPVVAKRLQAPGQAVGAVEDAVRQAGGETAAEAAARVTKATTAPTTGQFFESPQGAETLGRAAAQRGLPNDASPYPPGTPLDGAWKQGHTATTEVTTQADALKAIETRPPGTVEPIPPLTPEEQAAAANPRPVVTPAPTELGAGKSQTVEGTGPLRTRGLSAGIEQKALANKLTDTLGDLPEYRSLSMADQAAKATKLLADDPALARQVALGEAPPPNDLLPESVLVAVENKAINDGDVATLRELANGKLTEQATDMGRRIRTLAERNPESPVSAIQKVVEARTAKIANADEAISGAIETLKSHIAESTKVDAGAFQKFIDSLRC